MKPCRHAEASPGCRICFLFETRADYRALWDKPDEKEVEIEDEGAVRATAVPKKKGCGCKQAS